MFSRDVRAAREVFAMTGTCPEVLSAPEVQMPMHMQSGSEVETPVEKEKLVSETSSVPVAV
jgi:hypothetical protein